MKKHDLVLVLAGLTVFSLSFSAGSLIKVPSKNSKHSQNSFQKMDQKEFVQRSGSGHENSNDPPPFDFDDTSGIMNEAGNLLKEGKIQDHKLAGEIEDALTHFQSLVVSYKNFGDLSSDQILSLMDSKYNLENLLGLAEKGDRHLKSIRFLSFKEDGQIDFSGAEPMGGTSKVNTGWILDQKVYDPACEKQFPTIPVDIRSNDEGANDIEVDDDGYVWEVQSFYFSDTTSIPDHPNPSYCLGIYVSPDAGASWILVAVLYDQYGKDIINPRLAIDILPAFPENRFFIAYEYAFSATNHDVSVYSEAFLSDTPNPQDASIAASALMERNPDIASDYHLGQTSYRVVAFEKEASAGSWNYDIYASQSAGAGASADWSSPIAVAADSSSERNPSLSNGASGNSTFTQYMHLAYNYDSFSTTQMLLNSGFESGNNGNWTVNSTGDINCGGGYQRTGTCCAWLAGVNSYTDFIYQDVAVPASAVSASLSLYLKITSAEGTTNPYDYLYIQLRDASNNVLTTLQTLSNVNKTTYATYQPLTFNVLPYAGQTLRVYFLATTDGSNITSFFIDDTALNVTAPSGYEVRYAKAQHPGGTAYPNGLQSAAKSTVLSNMGVGWEYSPPSIIATHGGGSSTWTQGRVLVAADQHFPADNPNAGDLDRHQICYAWNMCNGAATCGTMTCGADTLSKNWQEGYLYDPRGDEKLPSLIQDGAGLQTSGLVDHPYLYMAYFHRTADSPSELGEIQMILTDPSDETCDGFIYAYWYYFAASYTVSDPDQLVSPVPRTINAFNYWDLAYAGAGATFNKRVSHQAGGSNDDVFFTTLGDNYTFNTFSNGENLGLVISLNGETYATPHTFPLPSNIKWDFIAESPQDESGYSYTFSNWSNAQTDPKLALVSEYCDPVNPCPEVNFTATYNRCLIGMPEVPGSTAVKSGAENVALAWSPISEVGNYAVYVSNNPSQKTNFRLMGTTTSTSYLDSTSASGPTYYYIIAGQCGTHEGPWGGAYDN
jgi:hypothetical protein